LPGRELRGRDTGGEKKDIDVPLYPPAVFRGKGGDYVEERKKKT